MINTVVEMLALGYASSKVSYISVGVKHSLVWIKFQRYPRFERVAEIGKLETKVACFVSQSINFVPRHNFNFGIRNRQLDKYLQSI